MSPHTITPAVGAMFRRKSSFLVSGITPNGDVKGNTHNGHLDPKCSSASRLRTFREDTCTPNEGAACAWMAADEAVGCTRAFLTMWPSSRRLVCQECPESGILVNDISRIHCSRHLFTTQLQN
ncbi:uncharacterized protein TNCV_3812981 [Trichonephila clavipes]|nr:uncharacterized protein TNCV_3812981 [Trichonephila clavipes]